MPENITKKQANLSRKEIIKRNLKELKRRREKGEIDPEPFPLDRIFYINEPDYEDRPLTRKDLGRQAIELTAREFDQLKVITILLKDGTKLEIFLDDFSSNPGDPEDILVIFPEDLGDMQSN